METRDITFCFFMERVLRWLPNRTSIFRRWIYSRIPINCIIGTQLALITSMIFYKNARTNTLSGAINFMLFFFIGVPTTIDFSCSLIKGINGSSYRENFQREYEEVSTDRSTREDSTETEIKEVSTDRSTREDSTETEIKEGEDRPVSSGTETDDNIVEVERQFQSHLIPVAFLILSIASIMAILFITKLGLRVGFMSAIEKNGVVDFSIISIRLVEMPLELVGALYVYWYYSTSPSHRANMAAAVELNTLDSIQAPS
eukprot:CAMPEP_0167750848 /NCGR_PEP_ID=MMETSP0110_2-20121227/6219_1 /TAXON_ID=629695 /ORGANISM="Gymnochlora sp., Strain CCMP2014" /LENGTH=257 /DNA_ID=CAMNT_0007636215 /DNA_START=177 /DNA_END=950 /DNA_ORIENTATION=-